MSQTWTFYTTSVIYRKICKCTPSRGRVNF